MSFLVYLKGIKCKISLLSWEYEANMSEIEKVLLIEKVSTSVSLDACGYWKTMERQYGR